MKWLENDDLIKSYILNGVDEELVKSIKNMYYKGVPIDSIRESLDKNEEYVLDLFLSEAFGKINEDIHIRKAYQNYGVRYDIIKK